MSKVLTVLRKIGGFPEPSTEPERGPGTPQPESATLMSPWEAAGASLARQTNGHPQISVPSETAQREAFAPVDEKSGALFARRAMRGLMWGVLGLACLTGLRTWFFPAHPKTDVVAKTPGVTFPVESAQQTGALFARAYLTWNQDNPDSRAQALAALLPSGADTTMGWDGHGYQGISAAQPGAVDPGSQHQATVVVDVQTHALIKRGTTLTAGADHWVELDVPVVDVGGHVIVSGEPGMIGIPASGPSAPNLPAPDLDPQFTAQTQDAVTAFFKAYAAGDTASAAAPGATIPDLPSGTAYDSLTSWAADAGSGRTRTGTARVSWTISGATIEQTYRVTLAEVSSSDAVRWQVAGIHGGSV